MAEPTYTPQERRDLWLSIFRALMADINRTPGPPIDRDDLRGYAEVLGSLRTPFLAGQISHTDPRIWRIRFALRDMQSRPSYSRVRDLVDSHMGAAAPVEARNVVTAPPLPALAAGPVPKEDLSAQTYRPDYERLPLDPRDWGRGHFESGREFFVAVSAAMRERRIPGKSM